MELKPITIEQLSLDFFQYYHRDQNITKCWRKVNGKWELQDISFQEKWGRDEILTLIECLELTINTGGYIVGAFEGDKLYGFASLEAETFGPKQEYLELSSIHVSSELRSKGTGRRLFEAVCSEARKRNAEKLYISSHSSKESQAFYMAMGCRETAWYHKQFVEREPYDCHLEYVLEPKHYKDIYETCPILEANAITLELVKMDDAKGLLACYEDIDAVKFMNSDNCDDDFHYTTLERMEQAIQFWLDSYQWNAFVRMTIRDKFIKDILGTIEMFKRSAEDTYDGVGVLRIDLGSAYETESILDEILYVSNSYFYDLFEVDTIITKAIPEAAQRRTALIDYGFQPAKDKFMGKYDDYYVRERKR